MHPDPSPEWLHRQATAIMEELGAEKFEEWDERVAWSCMRYAYACGYIEGFSEKGEEEERRGR